jgi:hypothetical protein
MDVETGLVTWFLSVPGPAHGVDSIPNEWRDKVLAAEGLRAGKRELHPRAFLRVIEEAYGRRLRE